MIAAGLLGGSAVVAAPLAGATLGGLYLAFDLAVLPALERRATHQARDAMPARSAPFDPDDDQTAAELMRRLNVEIVRPSFLTLLFGAPALAAAAAVAHPTPLTITAVLLQLAGLIVTIAINVPRNDALARDHDPDAWTRFIGPWRRAHRARTASALLAALLGGGALILG